jgi:membrane protease YdiL (CAAX protease family)
LATIIIICQQTVGFIPAIFFGLTLTKDHGRTLILSGIGTFLVAGTISIMMLRKKIALRYVWGSLQNFTHHWKHLLMILPLMALTMSYTGLCFSLLGKVAPEFVQSIIKGFAFDENAYGFAGKVAFALMGGVLIPIGEEIIFRGTILYRFASYKTLRHAVIASAILFACLHPHNIVGTFAFAYCAAVAYIYTRSLLIPIGIHILNNSLSFFADFVEYSPLQSPVWAKDVPDIADIQSIPMHDIMVLAALFIVSSLITWRYIKWHPITADTQLPYFAALDKSNQAISSSPASS